MFVNVETVRKRPYPDVLIELLDGLKDRLRRDRWYSLDQPARAVQAPSAAEEAHEDATAFTGPAASCSKDRSGTEVARFGPFDRWRPSILATRGWSRRRGLTLESEQQRAELTGEWGQTTIYSFLGEPAELDGGGVRPVETVEAKSDSTD